MKRTQLQLDEATYRVLRARAYEQGTSMAGLIREVLAEYLSPGPVRRKRIEEFAFIGSGRSSKSNAEPISAKHDEALTEDFIQ